MEKNSVENIQLKYMQYIQKLVDEYLNQITYSDILKTVIENRDGINTVTTDVMQNQYTALMKGIRATDESLLAKAGWALLKTTAKIGLNAVTMGLGGAALNELHDALGTHGSSLFELNKEMVDMQGVDGNQDPITGKVCIRKNDPEWERLTDVSAVGKQLASDLGDVVVGKAFAIPEKYLEKLDTLMNFGSVALNQIRNKEAMNHFSTPCLLLAEATEQVKNRLYELFVDLIHEETKGNVNDPKLTKDTQKFLGKIRDKIRDEYDVATHLAEIRKALPNVAPKEVLKRIYFSEVMTQGAIKLLSGKKELGKDIWKVYHEQGLVMKAKDLNFNETQKTKPDMFKSGVIESLKKECEIEYLEDTYKIKMSSHYTDLWKENKAWNYLRGAENQGILGISHKDTFGTASTLVVMLASHRYLGAIQAESDKEITEARRLLEWTPKPITL